MTPEKLLELAHEARGTRLCAVFPLCCRRCTADEGRPASIPAATLKMPPSPPPTAPSARLSSPRCTTAAMHIAAIAVVGGPAGEPGAGSDQPRGPCGVCRQVMQEFCGPDFEIHMQKAAAVCSPVKLPELLPFGFTKEHKWQAYFWRFSQKFYSALIFAPNCVIIAYGLEPK